MSTITPVDARQIGNQFTRLYYYLVNHGPQHLFWMQDYDSFLVHGLIDRPNEELLSYIGLQNINRKLASLGLQNSRVNILRVDSQGSAEESVMVQVLGEIISTNGDVRRFMQSFVLKCRPVTAYCIRNDIFNFEAEITDDVEESETTEDAEKRADDVGEVASLPAVSTAEQQASAANDEDTYSKSVEEQSSAEPTALEEEKTPEKAIVEMAENFQTEPSKAVKPAQSAVKQAEASTLVEMAKDPAPVKKAKTPDPVEMAKAPMPVKKTKTPDPVEMAKAPMPVKKAKESSAEAEQRPQKTWASLLAKKEPIATHPKAAAGEAAPAWFTSQHKSSGTSEHNKQTAQSESCEWEVVRRSKSDSHRNKLPSVESSYDAPQSFSVWQRYPDEHQLFVGNIPIDVTEEDLIVFFETYGNVIEFRLNTTTGGGRVPNFGFVVFDCAETPLEILNQTPIYYDESTRLNVEEKKPYQASGRYGDNNDQKAGSEKGDSRRSSKNTHYTGVKEYYRGGSTSYPSRR